MGSQGGWGQSKEFLDLVKSIGEARSKAEEDRIVLREIETLRRRIAEPDVTRRKMKEYIIRLVYVEMLGHDASFGYIHAVKMTHDDNVVHKRTGYLAVTLFLNENHDLIILIVNTIQKDLKSDNYLVVCAALTAVCKLINEETIPAVLPQVVDLLDHSKEAVRKKAVMALHRFYQRSPSSVSHLLSHFRKRFCDGDPGVMAAALCPIFDLITADVNSYKDLVVSFVSILKQVAERRFPKSYEYHQMPAPFIQVKLLKILALLGSGDKQSSGHMYAILSEIFRKCEMSSNIGNAVLYECICCVSSIHANKKLLDAATEATSKFLKSDSHNLKYMGIDALGRLIKINPNIAEDHQLAVIDCLEDSDDTLKRKTFELLYKMTKSTNVEVIVDRMINYMISISDKHYKTEIASRCVELAEQFAPSNQWFIQTMNKVFEHAGDVVNIKVAHNLMRLIAEGFGEDDDSADSQLRSSAVDSYLHILSEPKLPSIFLQVISWVLGEYGTADGKYSASFIIGKISDVAEAHTNDNTVKAYAITSIMKVCAFEIAAGRKVDMLPECQSLIDELLASHSTDLQQRAYEFQALLTLDAHVIQHVMPPDASCEDVEVDESLSFLDDFVRKAIEQGSQPYVFESERSGAYSVGNFKGHPGHGLRFEAYDVPKPLPPASISAILHPPPSADVVPVFEPAHSRQTTHRNPSSPSGPDVGSANVGVKLRLDGVQKKWGRPAPPFSSSSSSSSTSGSATDGAANGVSEPDGWKNAASRPRNPQVDISAEKQRLAASLFGSPASKSEKKPPSARPSSRGSNANSSRPASAPVVPSDHPKEKKSSSASAASPHPDLLDMGEAFPSSTPSLDPFKQLEGLIGADTAPLADAPNATDVMTLLHSGASPPELGIDLASKPSKNFTEPRSAAAAKKGPNSRDALEKDAVARQVGVTPTGNNPNLFRDLLG